MYKKLALASIFAVMGYMLTTRPWLRYMDRLSPISGLGVYYLILTVSILALEYFGLVIAGIKFGSVRQTIGTMMVLMAFFIIVDWESCYVNIVNRGSCDPVSNVYMQAEDGAVFYLWSKITDNVQKARILTYVVTPFVLALLGQNLITGKVTISPL
jgi:hypothetical protein